MRVDVTAKTGDFLIPDGWRGLGGLLSDGDEPIGTYAGADFRVAGLYTTFPVNVTVTSRKVNYSRFSKPAVRVRIEFVNDGDHNEGASGWLVLHNGQA